MGCPVTVVKISDADELLAQTNCYYCDVELGELYTLEHKKPLAKGGAHDLANICKACPACNETKHIQDELDYVARLDLAS